MTAAAVTPPAIPIPARPRHKQPVSSGAESDTAPSRQGVRPPQVDALSDRSTVQLIRRTLCPQQRGEKSRDARTPIEELLPPLTSRNDLDLQLYAFLAIILREFVQTWYAKITTDETFVAVIVHTIAHCTRALEQRLRKVDLESLVLDEIPDLLERHITAYRTAHQAPVSRPPVDVNARQVYHSLCPLPYLSPVPQEDGGGSVEEQQRNEAAYRQLLVQAALAILLPTEDVENPCLTALVGQILSELVMGNLIVNKAAQPWLLWEGICILASMMQGKKAARIAGRSKSLNIDKPRRFAWSAHGFFLGLINLCMVAITWARLLASAIMTSSSLPPRVLLAHEKEDMDADPADTEVQIVSVLDFRIWSCAGTLMELPVRMPWLSGHLSLLQHAAINGPGRIGRLNGTLDRVLAHHIRSLLPPSQIPALLRAFRGAIFPNNAPGKPTLAPPSSESELQALRRRAASAVLGLLPRRAARWYFGGRFLLLQGGGGAAAASANGLDDDQVAIDGLEGLLMVFSDEYCNKHLMYSIVELILVRLMPELRDKGVEELWEDRLG